MAKKKKPKSSGIIRTPEPLAKTSSEPEFTNTASATVETTAEPEDVQPVTVVAGSPEVVTSPAPEPEPAPEPPKPKTYRLKGPVVAKRITGAGYDRTHCNHVVHLEDGSRVPVEKAATAEGYLLIFSDGEYVFAPTDLFEAAFEEEGK